MHNILSWYWLEQLLGSEPFQFPLDLLKLFWSQNKLQKQKEHLYINYKLSPIIPRVKFYYNSYFLSFLAFYFSDQILTDTGIVSDSVESRHIHQVSA